MGFLCPSKGPLQLSPILLNRPSELSNTRESLCPTSRLYYPREQSDLGDLSVDTAPPWSPESNCKLDLNLKSTFLYLYEKGPSSLHTFCNLFSPNVIIQTQNLQNILNDSTNVLCFQIPHKKAPLSLFFAHIDWIELLFWVINIYHYSKLCYSPIVWYL